MQASGNNELGELLRLLRDSVQGTQQFVLEQAPDVIQQLILYSRIKYTAIVALGVLGILLLVPVFRLVYRKLLALQRDDAGPNELKAFVAGLGAAMPCIVLSIPIGESIAALEVLLQVWVAPKIFLLEYLAARLQEIS